MTTAAAGDHVTKAAGPKLAAKPGTTSGKGPGGSGSRSRQPAAPAKPWVEQSLEERYGSKPKVVSMGKQLKDCLRYLEAHQERGCISWEEITTQGIPHWYDTAEGGDLFNLLVSNPRVVATPRGFAYQSEHGIADKASLLRHIRIHPEGVRASDVKDGYDNVLEDAEALRAEGLLYKIFNAEFKVDVFFPVPQLHRHSVPSDLADLYLRADLPSEPAELISDLTTKFKLRSALASVASTRKPIALLKADRPKKKRKLNIRHITNTHMAHVLTDNQFTSID